MKPRIEPRTIATVALLLFIVASVAYLVVQETGGKAVPNMPPPGTNSVVVYYFHGNARCTTCRTIEAYTAEAVQTGCAAALESGRLAWRTVNVDDPANDHFIGDFQLSTRSVVLERISDGERRDWKNLDRVWDLVRSDKATFMGYVQNETRVFLEAADQ